MHEQSLSDRTGLYDESRCDEALLWLHLRVRQNSLREFGYGFGKFCWRLIDRSQRRCEVTRVRKVAAACEGDLLWDRQLGISRSFHRSESGEVVVAEDRVRRFRKLEQFAHR